MLDKTIKRSLLLCIIVTAILLLTSCRGDDITFPAEYEVLPMELRELSSFASNEPIGMYLLNEGNMGSNKATIDYVDFCNMAMQTAIRMIVSAAVRLTSLGQLPPKASLLTCHVPTSCVSIRVYTSNVGG